MKTTARIKRPPHIVWGEGWTAAEKRQRLVGLIEQRVAHALRAAERQEEAELDACISGFEPLFWGLFDLGADGLEKS